VKWASKVMDYVTGESSPVTGKKNKPWEEWQVFFPVSGLLEPC